MFSSIPFGAAAAMDSSPSQARVAAGGSHAHQQARAAAWLAAFGRSQRDYIGRTTERSLGRAELLALLSALPNSVGSASTAATELLSEGRPGVDHTRPGDPRMGAAGLLRAVADGLLPALPAQVPAAPVAPVTVRQRLTGLVTRHKVENANIFFVRPDPLEAQQGLHPLQRLPREVHGNVLYYNAATANSVGYVRPTVGARVQFSLGVAHTAEELSIIGSGASLLSLAAARRGRAVAARDSAPPPPGSSPWADAVVECGPVDDADESFGLCRVRELPVAGRGSVVVQVLDSGCAIRLVLARDAGSSSIGGRKPVILLRIEPFRTDGRRCSELCLRGSGGMVQRCSRPDMASPPSGNGTYWLSVDRDTLGGRGLVSCGVGSVPGADIRMLAELGKDVGRAVLRSARFIGVAAEARGGKGCLDPGPVRHEQTLQPRYRLRMRLGPVADIGWASCTLSRHGDELPSTRPRISVDPPLSIFTGWDRHTAAGPQCRDAITVSDEHVSGGHMLTHVGLASETAAVFFVVGPRAALASGANAHLSWPGTPPRELALTASDAAGTRQVALRADRCNPRGHLECRIELDGGDGAPPSPDQSWPGSPSRGRYFEQCTEQRLRARPRPVEERSM